MNSQFESKADGPQRTTFHMTKTFYDTPSDSLPESSKTTKSTWLRTSKETDSCHNPIRTRRPNPTRSRFLQLLQRWNYTPESGSNSQKMKNYHFSKAFRSRRTA